MSKVDDDAAPDARTDADGRAADTVLDEVRDALRGLRFGQVTIVVQDGVVVQIDRIERRRIQRKPIARPDNG